MYRLLGVICKLYPDEVSHKIRTVINVVMGDLPKQVQNCDLHMLACIAAYIRCRTGLFQMESNISKSELAVAEGWCFYAFDGILYNFSDGLFI